jgi:c-di-GMP-binding flagellar brake protein YcgR
MQFAEVAPGEMPELIRSIAARLRSIVGNRRRSPRLKARLPVTVSIALRKKAAAAVAAKPAPTLSGHTRDLSATGLALILPSILLGEQHLTGEGRTLVITLELPTGPIKIEAVPARYERLEEEATEKLYLIGARFTAMTQEDWTRLEEFLKTLK